MHAKKAYTESAVVSSRAPLHIGISDASIPRICLSLLSISRLTSAPLFLSLSLHSSSGGDTLSLVLTRSARKKRKKTITDAPRAVDNKVALQKQQAPRRLCLLGDRERNRVFVAPLAFALPRRARGLGGAGSDPRRPRDQHEQGPLHVPEQEEDRHLLCRRRRRRCWKRKRHGLCSRRRRGRQGRRRRGAGPAPVRVPRALLQVAAGGKPPDRAAAGRAGAGAGAGAEEASAL